MMEFYDENEDQIVNESYLYIYIFILSHDGSHVVEMCVDS